MAGTLSFVPRFHQEVNLPGAGIAGWMVVVAPGFDPLRHVSEIVDEQRRIEKEGGSIVVMDTKN